MGGHTKLLVFFALIVGVIGVCTGVSVEPREEQPIILPPIVQEGVEAALLIVPGAYINAQYYQPLGEAIQAASPLKLWIGLVRPFALDLPSPGAVFPAMEATLQLMRDAGMNTTNVLISGHSLGGIVLQDEEWSQQNGILGWVMMASYLPDGALPSCPLPVMHISGDLDGLTRIFDVHSIFKDLTGILPSEPSAVLSKAVVVLPDVNHMHFASGDPPPIVAEDDIRSSLSMADGQALIAEQVSAFLTTVLQEPIGYVDTAQAILIQAHQNTQALMQPIDLMEEVTEGEGVRSGWTEYGQIIMSSIKDHTLLTVTDTVYKNMDDFGASKPQLETMEGFVNITTFTHVYPNLENSQAVTRKEMASKFKSKEAIMNASLSLGAEFGDEMTCREVNQAALDLALTTASLSSRERYNSRGYKMTFLPDDVKSTGSQWLNEHLNYTYTEHGVEVTSASLPTGIDVGFGLGGMHYCKLLTPIRALEYIMADSLVGTEP